MKEHLKGEREEPNSNPALPTSAPCVCTSYWPFQKILAPGTPFVVGDCNVGEEPVGKSPVRYCWSDVQTDKQTNRQ
jgi:hypothetical protein